MREVGVDISGNKPKMLTLEMVETRVCKTLNSPSKKLASETRITVLENESVRLVETGES